eukprot:TRINITY_DN4588_c0_g1_i1.p1 TRINITY_DN4588_c0_g1~~TRINITY_DN4588_c0_g1_i1.p1  ORF type:complete len:271 (+),score=26.84 TRINITY_DN4588_c0_g1_i1:38-850(+)
MMDLTARLDMALDDVVTLATPSSSSSPKKEHRPHAGGRYTSPKRFSPRSDSPKPYARRAGGHPPPSHTGAGTAGQRVYVGNLSWTTSWQDLKDYMRSAGVVTRSDIFLDDSGRSKGCGIVEFSTAEEAQTAIRTLNDTSLPGTDRLIFVREDREDRNFGQAARHVEGRHQVPSHVVRHGHQAPVVQRTQGRQIFVGNLPFTTSWQDLKDKFRACGNIIRADMLLDVTGRPKGSGTVLFEAPREAQQAISMFDGTDFNGRIITVHEDKFAV